MHSLTYISGPPCSGKSIACQSLVKAFQDLVYIAGDKFWIKQKCRDFEDRVERTNITILEELSAMSQDHLLLEWVPSSGRFLYSLMDFCKVQARTFNQIIIYASVEELKLRKMARDGNEDIGEVDIDHYKEMNGPLVFDTTNMRKSDLQDTCITWLQARR